VDAATKLVQAYLHINGYFTAAEYPLVDLKQGEPPRIVTDIDMLAMRFGRAMKVGAKEENGMKRERIQGPMAVHTDPALKCREDQTDMIVAEIKQGLARVNSAARNPRVLGAALTRFGCCDSVEAPRLVERLLQHGQTHDQNGHQIRMVVFASRGEQAPKGWHWVHLNNVFMFLDRYLRTERQDLEKVELLDPALGWLSLLQKCQLTLESGESTT
jgi:hypothetical protein